MRNLVDILYKQISVLFWIRKKEFITPEGISFHMGADKSGGANERPQSQPAWEHEEMALLVVEYFYYKDSKAEIEKSNKFVSEILRRRGRKLGIVVGEKYRNYKGIESQRNNLSHFDPEYKGALTGHESKWMKGIVQEYINNPELVQREAYELVKKYMIE